MPDDVPPGIGFLSTWRVGDRVSFFNTSGIGPSRLLLKWLGPATVTEQTDPDCYSVELPHLFLYFSSIHASQIKRWTDKDDVLA